MYVERRSSVPGAVVWRKTPDEDPAGQTPVLPDGCTDLIWLGDQLIVAGPDTRPQYGPVSDLDVIGLRFAPGTAPSVFGVPAEALRNRRVALDQLWGSGEAQRAHLQVVTAVRRGAALEELAGRRLGDVAAANQLSRIARLCDAGWSTAAIAADTGWSERTLHRRAQHRFGYGTKTLTRILRFQRAVGLIRAGRTLAEVAAGAGYADQSHLSREIRELAGAAPTDLR